MKTKMYGLLWVACVGAALALSACDDGDSGDDDTGGGNPTTGGTPGTPTPAAPANLNGNWTGWWGTLGVSQTPMSLAVNHVGGTLSGSFADNTGNAGGFSGTFNGHDLAFTVILTAHGPGHANGETWSFSGDGNPDFSAWGGDLVKPGGQVRWDVHR
jgi:hypothetical protein